MNKVLIVDCQLLQTKAWHRGMGKYTASLLNEFLATNEYVHQFKSIILLTNSKLAISDELHSYLNQQGSAKHVEIALSIPTQVNYSESITRAQTENKQILTEYIQDNYPDAAVSFLITSLFLDEACPAFPDNAHRLLIYYDLIPLMYYRLYLGFGASEQYFTRFTVLLEADHIFAISGTVLVDLVRFLGVNPKIITNIDGSVNSKTISSSHAKRPNSLQGLNTKFILMPTGGDPRKNNMRAAEAFEIFNQRQNEPYVLVVTSIFSQQQIKEITEISASVMFSGNVSDDELWWLYLNCEGVFFPPEYEGLGMPIIEAVHANKLIACSEIPVFMEISDKAFFTFDPLSLDEMANALETLVLQNRLISKDRQHEYQKIKTKYVWRRTVRLFNEQILPNSSLSHKVGGKRKHVAIIMPHISTDSYVARYVTSLLPAIKNSDIVADWYFDGSVESFELVRPNQLGYACYPIRDVLSLDKTAIESYDEVWCFISNTAYSANSLQLAMSHHVIAVICDGGIDRAIEGGVNAGIFSTRQSPETYWKILSKTSKIISLGSEQIPVKYTLLKSGVPMVDPPSIQERSLHNRILVRLDEQRGLDQWNLDFVKFLSDHTDRGRVEVVVYTQTKVSEYAKNQLSGIRDLAIYEEVSDHEFFQLLQHSDLYVDAAPQDWGASVDMIIQAGYSASTEVLIMIEDSKDVHDNGVYVASSGNKLRKQMLRWLMGLPGKSSDKHKQQKGPAVAEVITTGVGDDV